MVRQKTILHNYFINLDISESSKRTYNYALRRLKKLSPNEDLKILNYPDKVDVLISKIAIKSQQIIYTSIINYFKVNDPNNLLLLTEYRKRSKERQTSITKLRMEQKLNKKIVDNFVYLADLKRVSGLIRQELKAIRDTSSTNFLKLTQWDLIINLYIKYPIRLEFGDMLIIKYKDYKKLNDTDINKTNYLIVAKTKIYIQLNNYKTIKTMGQIRYDVSRYLKTLIKRWLIILPSNNTSFLINYRTKQPLLRQGLHDTLKSIFKKYLNLKNVGVNAIRHARISELNKNEKSLKDKKTECVQFLHTQFEHDLYRHIE